VRGEFFVTSVMGHGLDENSREPGDEIKIAVFPSKLGSPESVIVLHHEADGTLVLGGDSRAALREGRGHSRSEAGEEVALLGPSPRRCAAASPKGRAVDTKPRFIPAGRGPVLLRDFNAGVRRRHHEIHTKSSCEDK